jgi:hypothetical protein
MLLAKARDEKGMLHPQKIQLDDYIGEGDGIFPLPSY